jgi:hypothetical protein
MIIVKFKYPYEKKHKKQHNSKQKGLEVLVTISCHQKHSCNGQDYQNHEHK